MTDLDPGGAERALVRVVTGLDRREWQPVVVCLSGGGSLTAVLEESDIPVSVLGARSPRDVGVVTRLTAELKRIRPQLLQTFLFHANLAGRLAASWARVPVVVSGVRVVEPDAPWRMRWDRWTDRLVTHHACVSRAVADRYRALGIAERKLSVIPNGVDVAEIVAAPAVDVGELGIPAGVPVVVAVGRLHPQKGFMHLLAAFEQLRGRDDAAARACLLIAGEGPERAALEADIARRGLKEQVRLLGWRGDIPSLLRAADLFVLSSLWEGMPNVVLEAMSAGVPVVATDVEGVRELIPGDDTGLLVPAGAPSALAAEIGRVLTDPALARRLGTAGQQRARKHFPWDRTVDGFVTLWRRLLTEQGRTSA